MSHHPCKDLLPALANDEATRVLEAFGPMPRETLGAMVAYGLSDVEISRYFNVAPDIVTALRQHYGSALRW